MNEKDQTMLRVMQNMPLTTNITWRDIISECGDGLVLNVIRTWDYDQYIGDGASISEADNIEKFINFLIYNTEEIQYLYDQC